MEQFEEQPCLHDENEDTAQETGHYKLPEGAVAAHKVDEDFWSAVDSAKKRSRYRERMRHAVARLCFMVLFVGIGIAISITSIRGSGWVRNLVTGDEKISFTLPVADKPNLDDEFYQADGRYTAEGIAKGFSPAVVSIEVYKNSGGYVAAGQGSGVIMSADGYIVTNAHVVNAAESGIKVVLSDNSEYEAKVVGQDPATDIAVIKIQAQGSPAGYYGTVTKGIVSGVNRRIRLENSSIIMNCIQIDAAINPGNSGGALFNMWGQVIGITSSKLASSDYEGIGFAVSIDEAKPVIEELMEKGYVAGRVKIGVTYYAVSDTTAEIYGIKPGICIVSINPDCDVANTDLAEGDIITEIDGNSTAGEVDIASLFSGKQAGDEVACKVYRKTDSGDEKEFEIKFKLMADNGGLVTDSQNK